MKLFIVLGFVVFLTSFLNSNLDGWLTEEYEGFRLHYRKEDVNEKGAYLIYLQRGNEMVSSFWQNPFDHSFDVYMHPNRHSLDSTWRQDWNLPSFSSECWMVASGVGARLDLLSPRVWEQEACEHIAQDTEATQKLIAHELFHVYHGQKNVSSDFSEVFKIDWFVEGLATFASGQCDEARIREVKNAIINNDLPASLDDFWTGKLRYGLSGSVVMFLDHHFGRSLIWELLEYNTKEEILTRLEMNEAEIISGWKKYILAT